MTIKKQRHSHKGTLDSKIEKDFVETPAWLSRFMYEKALELHTLRSGSSHLMYKINALDPCAGDGAMIRALSPEFCVQNRLNFTVVDCVLSRKSLRHQLGAHEQFIVQRECNDFLLMNNATYPFFDIAVVNPPFSSLQSIKFAQAIVDKWLSWFGVMMIIIPAYVFSNTTREWEWFRRYVSHVWQLKRSAFAPAAPVVHAFVCAVVPEQHAFSDLGCIFDFLEPDLGEQELLNERESEEKESGKGGFGGSILRRDKFCEGSEASLFAGR